ncbi:hypothetical protein BDV97DRAFT_292852 [Delphinella strobiligena]|nr:hypothetical protein BDV97DRAFT_292852 [Delphinella strobiligena]
MSSEIPSEAPPPYTPSDAQASSSNAAASSSNATSSSSFLHPHRARNGIPPAYRRSMEDEGRPLPKGWVRQYDDKSHHQFFVNTSSDPPRSIWHHPYDDEEYLSTQSSEERERIQELSKVPTPADLVAESSDEEDHGHELPPRPGKQAATSQSGEKIGGVHRLGRKMKDKVTSTTHEQREAERKQRAERERKEYERHQAYRRAMSQAMQTGQPQYLGKDHQGKDVYIAPPEGMDAGYSTYNGRMRPYGYGYGGGYGLPLAGGLAGGLLLGGVLGGVGF